MRNINVQEAARQMHLPEETIREMCRRGDLPGANQRRDGAHWRIPEESVTKWLAEHKKKRPAKKITSKNIVYWLGAIASIITIIGLITFVQPIKDQLEQWGILGIAPSAKEGEILIVVFNFYRGENVVDTEIQTEITRAIRQTAAEQGFSNLRVEIDPRQLRNEDLDRAKTIGERYKAAVVIWGEDTGIRVSVNFLDIKNPYTQTSSFQESETLRSQLANPSKYALFVTNDIPNRLRFLSFFAIGRSYAHDDQYENAISMFKTVLEFADPKIREENSQFVFETYWHLGTLYDFTGLFQNALEANNDALALQPNDPNLLNNRAVVYMHLDRLEEARNELERVASLKPDFAVAYLNLGLANYQLGNSDLAIEMYTKTIYYDDENYFAYINRGNIYDIQDKYTVALQDYATAIKLAPSFPMGYFNRAITYKNLREFNKAIDDLTKAISLYDDKSTGKMLAYYYRGQDYVEIREFELAIADYDKALSLKFPSDQDCLDCGKGSATGYLDYVVDRGMVWYSRGIALSNLGKYTDAISSFYNALAFYSEIQSFDWQSQNSSTDQIPYDPFYISDIYLALGKNQLWSGDPIGATESVNTSLLIYPPHPDYMQGEIIVDSWLAERYFFLGMAYRSANEPAKAVDAYSQALKYQPLTAEYYNNRGNAYLDLKQFENARDDLSEAILLMPDYYLSYRNRAIANYYLGDFESALQDCQSAQKLNSNDPEVYYWFGEIYYTLESYPQAIRYYELYLKLSPNAGDREKIEKRISEIKSK